MKRVLGLMSWLVCASSVAGTQFTYDGHYDASEYDKTFSITYEYDNRVVTGGTLALATVGDKQYLYISHPLGFKDLSYGGEHDIGDKDYTSDDSKYTVGWENIEHGAKDLKKAIGSEFITLSLTGSDNQSYTIKMDTKFPDEDSKLNGTSVDAGEAVTLGGFVDISYISTIDYNAALYNGWGNLTEAQQASLIADKSLEIGGKNYDDFFNGELGVFEDHSPETLTPAELTGCEDEKDSDPACYVVRNTAENANVMDWDFNWGLEIELDLVNSSNLFFANLAAITTGDFGYQDGNQLISLDDLHASDPKHGPGHHTQGNCPGTNTQSPDHEPCNATVVPPEPPVDVPEPSSLAILAMGILALCLRKRQA